MKIRFVPLAVLLLLGLGTPAQAQEPERGQLYEVAIMKVDPGSLMTFIEDVIMFKAAAEAANLPEQFGWQTWMRDFEIGFVSAIPNMAWLDDEQAFMSAFEGTAGEEMFAQAMETWEADGSIFSPASREIWEHEVAWSYDPGESGISEITGAEMLEFWIKPGMEEEFEAVAAEVGTFLNELGGPYATNGFRTVIGDVSKVTWATFHDGREDYYGVNSMDAAMAEAGKVEEWQALVERFAPCVTESRSSGMQYVIDASYAPSGG
jgi:hypothetical protein